MSIGRPILRYRYFKTWPSIKIHGQGHVCSQLYVKVTFDIQISKVMVRVKVKPTGLIWGLELNQFVCFSFGGNQTTQKLLREQESAAGSGGGGGSVRTGTKT